MNRYQREVLRRLEGIESALKRAVELLEERVKETPSNEREEAGADKWLREGIAQILEFQPGKVRPKEE